MVQYIGNTLQVTRAFKNVMDAMERDSKSEPTNRLCDGSDQDGELSGVVPQIRD
jgi:hypothetical protein